MFGSNCIMDFRSDRYVRIDAGWTNIRMSASKKEWRKLIWYFIHEKFILGYKHVVRVELNEKVYIRKRGSVVE